MESIIAVSDRIVSLICPDKIGQEKSDAVYMVKRNIHYLVGDLLSMIKNINETSLPGDDRKSRILELEEKYDIPKTHIL